MEFYVFLLNYILKHTGCFHSSFSKFWKFSRKFISKFAFEILEFSWEIKKKDLPVLIIFLQNPFCYLMFRFIFY